MPGWQCGLRRHQLKKMKSIPRLAGGVFRYFFVPTHARRVLPLLFNGKTREITAKCKK